MKVNKIIKSNVETELEITGATLLSVEEAEKYLAQEERTYRCWWWLRSPGLDASYAADVVSGGGIDYTGDGVDSSGGCVRPALQINNLKSSNLEVGDIFEIRNYKFKVISESLAWMYGQDIGRCAFNEDIEKGNDYETSDVKMFVDKWCEKLKGEEEDLPDLINNLIGEGFEI